MNLVCPLCGVSVQGEKAQVVSTTYLCRDYGGDALWNDVLLTLETNHTLVLYGGGGKKTACDFVACGDELLSDKDEKICTVMRGDVMTAERDAAAALKDRVEKTKRSKK